jgi:nitroreductase
MDFLQVIKTRRSIRDFLDKEIPNEKILKILDVARYAPSAGNLQDWFFFVVKEKEKIKEISKIAFNQRWIKNAAFLIVACSDLGIISYYGERGINLYSKQDVACAIQNMLLFAWKIGIGSCWVGAFDEKALRDYLLIPEKFKPQAIIAFGYPRNIPTMPKRKKLEKIYKFI